MSAKNTEPAIEVAPEATDEEAAVEPEAVEAPEAPAAEVEVEPAPLSPAEQLTAFRAAGVRDADLEVITFPNGVIKSVRLASEG